MCSLIDFSVPKSVRSRVFQEKGEVIAGSPWCSTSYGEEYGGASNKVAPTATVGHPFRLWLRHDHSSENGAVTCVACDECVGIEYGDCLVTRAPAPLIANEGSSQCFRCFASRECLILGAALAMWYPSSMWTWRTSTIVCLYEHDQMTG